jgi:hypothetical protein
MSKSRWVQPFSRTDGRLDDVGRIYDANTASSTQGHRQRVAVTKADDRRLTQE